MQISNSPLFSEKFKSPIFFNHAISGASIEDYIAILELYLEKGNVPKSIIIGVDPWILNANNEQDRWTVLKDEYQKGSARFNLTLNMSEPDSYNSNHDIDRYSSLISQPIIIKSIDKLLSGSYYPTDLNESDVGIKLKDGSLRYPKKVRTTTVDQIDTDASNYAKKVPIYSLGNFTQIDEKSKSQFESTIHYIKSRNATIILFLPPYHPIVYNKMTNDPQYSNLKEVEFYFKHFASTENITIIGSYDPNRMNLTSADFYDGSHLRREAIDELFAA
jgi:hypothetical protein